MAWIATMHIYKMFLLTHHMKAYRLHYYTVGRLNILLIPPAND
jgi:hypothetical protein